MPQSFRPQIIAHRGASHEAPENTLAAIERAIALKVDSVEIDIRLSKDGIPVVLHDPSAARLTGVKNAPPIHLLTLAEIQQIDVGRSFSNSFTGEKIPSLREVLELNWNQTELMIEIKEGKQHHKVIVQALFDVLAQIKKPSPQLLIGSFSSEILKEVSSYLPSYLQGADSKARLIGIVEKPLLIEPFIAENIKHLALWYKLVTPDLVRALKDKGIKIWSFTIDDVKTAEFLISIGVSGIISNNPKRMLDAHIFNSNKHFI